MIRKAFSLEHIAIYLFIVLGLLGILHHEMWLDELYDWVLARDSNTIKELFYNARYGAHPYPWNTFLFIITRFTHNPTWMQILNLSFSSCAAFLVLKYSPFSTAVKILIVFGYFFFYEYTVISRSYSLGMLLIVWFCLLYQKRTHHYFLISLVLGLLANTQLFCLEISFSFFMALLLDFFFHQVPSKRQKTLAAISMIIYLTLLLIALVHTIPPSDSRFNLISLKDFSFHRIGSGISILTKGFMPIPDLTITTWWNTNLFASFSPVLNGLIAVLILIFPLLIFYKKLVPLIIFYLTAFSTMLFISLTQVAAERYYGYVFFSFIAALWIDGNHVTQFSRITTRKFERIRHNLKMTFIYSIFSIQMIAGIVAWSLDINQPFSQAFNTVNYLRNHNLSNELVAVSPCNSGPPISGYLNQKIFYPQINEWGSFAKWNLPFEKVGIDSVLTNAETLSRNRQQDVVMILNDSFPEVPSIQSDSIYQVKGIQIQFLQKFIGSAVKTENYFIYRVYSSFQK